MARVSRRTALGTVTLAGTALGLADAGSREVPVLKLRVLATSDLHMFVLDWDYFAARPDPSVGFANAATLIRQARGQSANTLLFDNGDFLQGNPLADYIAAQPRPVPPAPHPIIAIMGQLGYDAACLGNHEFNFGLEFLEAALAGAPFPVVCANVVRTGATPFMPPSAVLERTVTDEAGLSHVLLIGLIGLVPPQIMAWDKARLDGKLESSDMVLAARRIVPDLRARCDVVVALCHAGIRTDPWTEGMENAALHVAAVPGIDVIITGHCHRVFPGPDYAALGDGVDAVIGRLNGVPAVMPGFWGSHLGVVDLTLTLQGDRWSVTAAAVETRPVAQREHGAVTPLAAPDAAVAAAIAPAHEATLAWVEQPAGTIDTPIHSFFVWAGYDPGTALINAAQLAYARPLLAGTPYADLPLLSSAAPYRAGYTPGSYIDILAGRVSLRDAANLYLFSNNTVVALKVTGRQLLEWLETSARAFRTIDPAAEGAQPLVDRSVPSYAFDAFAGLTYTIDVTKPPRYDGRGVQLSATRRIDDVRFDGAPLPLDREFIVITNNYRADSRANIPDLAQAEIVLRAPDSNQEALLRYFRFNGVVTVPKTQPWSFAPTGKAIPVHFDTARAALTRLGDIPGLTHAGPGEPGYDRVQFTI